jgi:hypothetical protein
MFEIVYAEDNPLWILFGLLLLIPLLAIILFLGACYLAGLGLARLIERWLEARESPRVQAKSVLR